MRYYREQNVNVAGQGGKRCVWRQQFQDLHLYTLKEAFQVSQVD